MGKISPQLRREITDFILQIPNISNSILRKDLALHADFPRNLFLRIDWTMQPNRIFVAHFLETVLKWGQFSEKDSRCALIEYLKAAKAEVGGEQQRRVSKLIKQLNTALYGHSPASFVEPLVEGVTAPHGKAVWEKIQASWTWLAGGGAVVLVLLLIVWQGPVLLTTLREPPAPTRVALASPTPVVEPSPMSTAVSTLTLAPTLTSTPRPTSTPKPTSTPTPDPHVPPANAKLGDTWTRPKDGMMMVYVPAGGFEMGSTEGSDDEQPVHTVALAAYWMDQTEVTNAQYVECVAVGECDASAYADDADWNGDEYPVVGVSWFDAQAYCAWAGAQLLTEAQWEYAARGDDGRIYPWGNELPTCDLAQFRGCAGDTKPVGSFLDGASWVGALDLAGNVWEWCYDWYGPYSSTRQENPTGSESGESRVLRGGSWSSLEGNVRSADRYGIGPTFRYNNVGFRCAVVVSGE